MVEIPVPGKTGFILKPELRPFHTQEVSPRLPLRHWNFMTIQLIFFVRKTTGAQICKNGLEWKMTTFRLNMLCAMYTILALRMLIFALISVCVEILIKHAYTSISIWNRTNNMWHVHTSTYCKAAIMVCRRWLVCAFTSGMLVKV